MRIHIFANGLLDETDRENIRIAAGERVIAADGGLQHCLRLNIQPDLVVGDFDSLSEVELEALEESGVQLERHPVAKDETDLELALAAAARWGADEVRVYGALGARWDMSVANLLLLAHPDYQSLSIRLIAGRQTLRLVQAGETVQLHGQSGDLVSLIPLRGEAAGVRTVGLAYPLRGETLNFGYTRGISNVMQGSTAQISLEEGLLLCVQATDPEQA